MPLLSRFTGGLDKRIDGSGGGGNAKDELAIAEHQSPLTTDKEYGHQNRC